MRISGGIARGRILKAPAGQQIRPTSDKVKQALFNILGEHIQGATVLDLFAGVGGVGIEALSRGASSVTFVDASKKAIQLVHDNLEHVGLLNLARVVHIKAELFLLKPSGPYTVIFLDPPYAESLQPLLDRIGTSSVLADNGVVIAEHFKKQAPAASAGDLILDRQACYGDTILAFYRMRKSTSSSSPTHHPSRQEDPPHEAS